MTDPFTRATQTYISAQRTNQANGSSYHMADKPVFSWLDLAGVMLKPSTIIGLSILGVCVWMLCGFPGASL